MHIARLSTKGRIALPKNIRMARAWGPGTEFVIEETRDGILLRPAKPFAETSLEEVAGSLRSKARSRTIEQMNRAVAREVVRRRRGRY